LGQDLVCTLSEKFLEEVKIRVDSQLEEQSLLEASFLREMGACPFKRNGSLSL
jgi:hypothetical protein